MKEYKYKINGTDYAVTVGDFEDNNVQVTVNGTVYNVEMEESARPKIKPVVRPASSGAAPAAPIMSRPAAGAKGGVKSPLPGVILEIKVREGDTVTVSYTHLTLPTICSV